MDLTWRSGHDRRTQVALTLLLVLCVHPVCYTTFLYGNLPGLCLSLWALDCLLRWLTGGRRRWIVPALTLMALAVVLKPNYLIFALAAALVTALYALGSRRLGALLVCAGLLAAPWRPDRLARLALEKRTGFPLGAGAPQTTWLAMGMQEGPLAPGLVQPLFPDAHGARGAGPRHRPCPQPAGYRAAAFRICRRPRLRAFLLSPEDGLAVGGNHL